MHCVTVSVNFTPPEKRKGKTVDSDSGGTKWKKKEKSILEGMDRSLMPPPPECSTADCVCTRMSILVRFPVLSTFWTTGCTGLLFSVFRYRIPLMRYPGSIPAGNSSAILQDQA